MKLPKICLQSANGGYQYPDSSDCCPLSNNISSVQSFTSFDCIIIFFFNEIYVVLLPFCIPRCVVWTGDDKVFFFNPTIQLSVWDKPIDLKNRVDINRIIEDPPHKRKFESPSSN